MKPTGCAIGLRLSIIGELKALDSPLRLKSSIAGRNVIEVGFCVVPRAGKAVCGLARRHDVTRQDAMFRIESDAGPVTAQALLDAARAADLTAQSLSSRARRSTMSSCTTRDGTCATRPERRAARRLHLRR
jgi:hypothetical protein